MNQKLTELFQKKQKPLGSDAGIDWDSRRDEYLSAVRDLYDQIEKMLVEPIGQKTVATQRRPKQLTENFIGTYSAEDLVLVIGDEHVRFSPRGRNIVGAAGRVDVLGDRNEATLVFVPQSGWGFVQSRQPRLEIVPFDESTLADVLKLVMRD
jgi:hypothetical protein